jgi:hypothetical protein
MPVHTIVEGDHLSRVAREHGFLSIKPIWNHPANSSLASQRVNPLVLAVGDVVVIPDFKPRTDDAGTNNVHTFVARVQPLLLRLRLFGPGGVLDGVACELAADDAPEQVFGDGQGGIDRPIQAKARRGRIIAHLEEPKVTMAFDFDLVLLIGHLQPVDTEAGIRSRLSNLGYLLTDEPEDTEALRSAVEEFQCDAGLTVDGKVGKKTRAALLEAHGT